MALNLKHQTGAQLAARFRERFRNASKEEAARLATWLLSRIEAGDYTDAQVRSAFGLTVTQYNSIKTRMSTLRANWLAVQSAQGE